jgi:hypothetical protein
MVMGEQRYRVAFTRYDAAVTLLALRALQSRLRVRDFNDLSFVTLLPRRMRELIAPTMEELDALCAEITTAVESAPS